MGMRKLKGIIVLLAMIIIAALPLAAASTMKLYDYDDDEYRLVQSLCRAAGVTGPSSATPVTGHELIIALERIDSASLSAAEKGRYEGILAELNNANGSFQMDFDIYLAPQVFLTVDQFGNEGIIEDRNDFFLPYNQETKFAAVGAGFDFGDYVFLEVELPLANSAISKGMTITSFDWLVSYRDGQWQFAGNKNQPALLAEIPFLARGAVGNDWINLIVGRTEHQMGSGFTGNMIVGNNFPYQELMKLSATSNIFTYNISFTHFDNQSSATEFERAHFGGHHQNRVIHRFDFNILDRVRAVVNFGATYWATSAFDFRFFTPFMIAHNYYNNSSDRFIESPHDEANNIFAVEIEAALMPGLSLGAQFVMDQVQMPHETAPLPNAFGGLLNLAWTEHLENSSYTIWLEGAYTTPYLYLNEKYNDEALTDPNYNYDWILGYFYNDYQASTMNYSGYPYGPDSIVVAAGAQYDNYEHHIKADGRLVYSVTGEKGGRGGMKNPIFGDFTGKNTPTGIAWHVIKLEGNATWECIRNLEVLGGVSLQCHVNYKNQDGNTRFIPQTYFGVKWTIL